MFESDRRPSDSELAVQLAPAWPAREPPLNKACSMTKTWSKQTKPTINCYKGVINVYFNQPKKGKQKHKHFKKKTRSINPQNRKHKTTSWFSPVEWVLVLYHYNVHGQTAPPPGHSPPPWPRLPQRHNMNSETQRKLGMYNRLLLRGLCLREFWREGVGRCDVYELIWLADAWTGVGQGGCDWSRVRLGGEDYSMTTDRKSVV